MKRLLMILAALALLVVPVMPVAGQETAIPPEAHWSPEPPTPAQLLVSKQKPVREVNEQSGGQSTTSGSTGQGAAQAPSNVQQERR